MPIRNLWSLTPGECLVSEKVMKETGHEVYFPLRDIGVDLLVADRGHHVGLQVKESRYYTGSALKGKRRAHSWHKVHEEKFLEKKEMVDFYIFLTYVPVHGTTRISRFEHTFLVIPTGELGRRMRIKNPGEDGIYHYYFHFADRNVWDDRIITGSASELANYSQFLDAWHLLEEAL